MGAAQDDETLQPRVAPAPADRFAVGSTAGGRYRIVRFIASGGMGEVYAAEDLLLDTTTVALKTLRPELEGSASAIERLRREISLARSVTNTHICRMHDVGEHEGRVFLTMELLEGRTLSEIIGAQPPLALAEVDRLARQLVDGLSALHRAGIVHRDFKPSNVIVVDDGDSTRAVITDFGLARQVDAGESRLTLESGMLGTPAYMAPEQVEARPVTPASDVYALGIVLFEMLTATLPFDEDTAMATATARLHRDAPRPSSRRKDVPRRWDAIVERCLARDPDARPQNVDDVLGAVPRSRRWFLAAAGAVAASGAIGVWAKTRSPQAIAAAQDVIALIPLDGDGDWLGDPWRAAMTLDLHDALVSAGIMLLPLHAWGMDRGMNGRAAQLANDKDPTAAALTIDRVTSVVRARPTIDAANATLELEVIGRSGSRTKRTLTRPRDQVAHLLVDAASMLARHLRFPEPHRPTDLDRWTSSRYEIYGAALGGMYRRRPGGKPLWEIVKTLEDLLADEPGLVRVAAVVAETYRAVAEDMNNQTKSAGFLDTATKLVDDALTRDPDWALAHATRGYVAMLRWDWRLADTETARAIELAPHHERAFDARNFHLMLTGRFDEAIALAERETLPDPRIGLSRLAWGYYYARRWQEVVRVIEPVIDKLQLDNWLEAVAVSSLALAYAEMAQFDRAVALADKLKAAKIDEYSLASLASVYAMAGRVDDAKAIQAQLGDSVGLDAAALMADALGQTDVALDKIEQLVDNHNVAALFLKIERYSIAVRSHPRYQALMKRVGLPA